MNNSIYDIINFALVPFNWLFFCINSILIYQLFFCINSCLLCFGTETKITVAVIHNNGERIQK